MKNRKPIRTWYLLIIPVLFILHSTVKAQYGHTTINTLEHITSNRAIGMAAATVAMPNYAGAFQVNPAAVGAPGFVRLTTNIDPAGDPLILAPGISTSVNRFSLAYNYTFQNTGSPVATRPAGSYFSVGHPSDHIHTFTIAYQLKKDLRIGLGINYVHSTWNQPVAQANPDSKTSPNPYWWQTETTLNRKLAFDFGLLYGKSYSYNRFDLQHSYGWSLTSFGTPVDYKYTSGSLFRQNALPAKMRAGFSLKMAIDKKHDERDLVAIRINYALSKYMVDVSYDVVDGKPVATLSGPFEALFTSWDKFRQPYYNPGSDPQYTYKSYRLGQQLDHHSSISLILLDVFRLSTGIVTEGQVNGGNTYITYGLGMDAHYVTIELTGYNTGFQAHNSSYNSGITAFPHITVNLPVQEMFNSSK